MGQTTKTNGAQWVANVMNQLTTRRKKLPASWVKAAGLIRDSKQRRDLERHVKKIRAEWR